MSKRIVKHHEVEDKFHADGISIYPFMQFCQEFDPEGVWQVHPGYPDVYYRQGDSVVRHRLAGGGSGELTTKLRHDAGSIQNRHEIDLRFAPDIDAGDVQAFMEATGWVKEFAIDKACMIFWIRRPQTGILVSIVLYDSWLHEESSAGTERRFLEVEVEKSNNLPLAQARAELAWWRKTISDMFVIGEPMNESLYEVYSGRNYRLA